ncbi:MAG: hypothetical protein U0W24_26495 [Bacteroidales bacterium]
MIKESKNIICFTCEHILYNNMPILYVAHDIEGDWQFLCGKNNHNEKEGKVIFLKEAIEIDATLINLLEMPIGSGVERKFIGDNWRYIKL